MQFSKAMVFEAYSEYVNNFTLAFETSKKQARSKQAFAEFLKVRHCHVHVTVANYTVHVQCTSTCIWGLFE